MSSCYDVLPLRGRHTLSGAMVVVATTAVVVGVVTADLALTVGYSVGASAAVTLVDGRARWWMAVVVVALAAFGVGRAGVERAAAVPQVLGRFDGWARVIDDPRPSGRATRVVVEIEGQRFEVWGRGSEATDRLRSWRAGSYVLVTGERRPLPSDRADRVRWQHVVGEFRVRSATDMVPGGALARSTDAVRDALDRGARHLGADRAPLFRGLVLGDRRDQDPAAVDRFRASGLSHLLVVSGMNVALVLAMAGPVLRRLGPRSRWAATLALLGWFVVLTRAEPSVLRAATMAAIASTAYLGGWDRAAPRLLCLAVIVLVLVDPLLVGAVGFWLSVGATAGVTTVGPWFADRLRLPGPLAATAGMTLGAQLGVAVPMLVAFGSLPLVSVPANLAAVPVASLVKLYGLPAGVAAGIVDPVAPQAAAAAMWPVDAGVRWVDRVARVAAASEPAGWASAAGWALLACGVVVALRRRPATTSPGHGDPPPHR